MNLNNVLKWAGFMSAVVIAITGIATISGCSESAAEPRSVNEVSMHHPHGMGYTADGNSIFFAVHDGLRVYEKGQWIIPAGEQHDFMGFSMVDDGFYASGHPAQGSGKKDPLGIVKSTDEGRSFETLALYGQVDFHGMSVGYNSHAIYLFNPQPNSKMKTHGLHYSIDETKSWTRSEMKGLEGEPAALAVHPTNEAVVAVGTGKGVYVSKDYGQQFEKAGPDMQITALYFNSQGELLAGSVNNQAALIRIDPESKQAESMNTPLIMEDAIAFITQNPVNEQEMALMTYNKDVFLSSDHGKNWTKIVDQGKGKSEQK